MDEAHGRTANRRVVVVDHDPTWPLLFEQERELIVARCPWVRRVEHIGSTAVPGLPAKPTIDVLAVVGDAELPPCVPAFGELGYQHVAQSFAEDPQHLFFHRLRGGERTHHLHVVTASSPLTERYLLFRDYLRAHPRESARYADFKQDLAGRFAGERDRYVDAKPPFVDALIERARRWRSRQP